MSSSEVHARTPSFAITTITNGSTSNATTNPSTYRTTSSQPTSPPLSTSSMLRIPGCLIAHYDILGLSKTNPIKLPGNPVLLDEQAAQIAKKSGNPPRHFRCRNHWPSRRRRQRSRSLVRSSLRRSSHSLDPLRRHFRPSTGSRRGAMPCQIDRPCSCTQVHSVCTSDRCRYRCSYQLDELCSRVCTTFESGD